MKTVSLKIIQEPKILKSLIRIVKQEHHHLLGKSTSDFFLIKEAI